VAAQDPSAPGIDVDGERQQFVSDFHLIDPSIDRSANKCVLHRRVLRPHIVPDGIPPDIARSDGVQRRIQRTIDVMAIDERRARKRRDQDDDSEREAQPQMDLQDNLPDGHTRCLTSAVMLSYRGQGTAKLIVTVRPRPAM
jgi:hypothetical protein